MRIHRSVVSVLVAGLLGTGAVLADSVAVTSGPDGTVIIDGKPCRVVTRHDGNKSTTNSTTITTGRNGVSGSTTVSPGPNSSSVTVGSGSSSDGKHSSSAAGSDCVIYRDQPAK
jgi:hypothetical protein